ncbi:winged helix-turn-helix domain-containing protein [Leyella stercorea]
MLKATGLNDYQALLSLGWLEREDKVSLHGENGMIEAVTLYQERYF